MNEDKKEKLLNLLADQALFGLSAAESAELETLKKEFPEFQTDDSFEIAAAAINLSNLDTSEHLPMHLQSQILSQADAYFDSSKQSEDVSHSLVSAASAASDSSIETRIPWWSWLGWGVAALACVALAFILFSDREPRKNNEIVQNPMPTQTMPPLSNQQKREQMMSSAMDIVQASWKEADPKSGKRIFGDVVWSDAAQTGYMKLSGLPVNDPGSETYQLWIFDENQSEKYPVDGGVFNVAANGEVIIPIDAKINVKKPKMFAVTKEKPGGVVVSDRRRMVALAKV